jgi:hypothetical protein
LCQENSWFPFSSHLDDELRVQQIEHPWHMDRQWRMESGHLCYSILQTVEDEVLSFVDCMGGWTSFDSARLILSEI